MDTLFKLLMKPSTLWLHSELVLAVCPTRKPLIQSDYSLAEASFYVCVCVCVCVCVLTLYGSVRRGLCNSFVTRLKAANIVPRWENGRITDERLMTRQHPVTITCGRGHRPKLKAQACCFLWVSNRHLDSIFAPGRFIYLFIHFAKSPISIEFRFGANSWSRNISQTNKQTNKEKTWKPNFQPIK